MNLSIADYPEHVQTMIEAALAAADPTSAVQRHLRRERNHLLAGPYRYDLARGRVFLVAAGKAALSMGKAALRVLQGNVASGVIVTKHTTPGAPRSYEAAVGQTQATVKVFEASHPVSDESSIRATSAVIEMLKEASAGDLVLCLISGGTSALLTRPYVTLEEWQRLTQALLESGCTINELNTVRKQLDQVKGGGLAQLAAPAATVSLILSDVVGNPLDIIGSGPTAPNPESPAEALTVLHRYHIAGVLPRETWETITAHLTDPRSATSVARFQSLEVKNVIVGDVHEAAKAAASAATDSGFEAALLTVHLEGEAREVGRVAGALAKDAHPGEVLILGGETTVTVEGDGRGGRNQELALAAALALNGWEGRVIASFATDGEDGPTDAAGAVVTGKTASQAQGIGLNPREYLDRNDSYTFFARLEEQTGQAFLLRPGSTGTNVNDLLFVLRYPD